MSPAEFLKSALAHNASTSSCQVDLEDIGEPFSETQSALYIVVDAKTPAGSLGRGGAGSHLPLNTPFRLVHVISRRSRGEVRGYVWHGDKLDLRYPARPEEWDEVDRAVEAATGARVHLAKDQA